MSPGDFVTEPARGISYTVTRPEPAIREAESGMKTEVTAKPTRRGRTAPRPGT